MTFAKNALLNLPAALALCCMVCLASLLPAANAQSLLNPDPNPASVPTSRLSEGWWAQRHQQVLAQARAHPDAQLLLIGDSITNNYDKTQPPDQDFQPTWQQFYAPRKALNLGFSGDTTQNVLWRLDHGELDGLHPKVAMLLIGTNNTGHAGETALQAELGIDAVVRDLEVRLPQTHILLLGILPSALSALKTGEDTAINRYLAVSYGENPRVTFLDIGAIFYHDAIPAHGDLDTAIYYDPRLPQHGPPLHPDTQGQHNMAEAIEPTLARLMGDAPRMPLDAMTDINTAVIPVPKLEEDSYDWFARHHDELATQQSLHPEIVLLGDSITHFWAGPPYANRSGGPQAWAALFGNAPVQNMGFGWDRSQNVLWRLQQGEFTGLTPRWLVLNIGTNNLTGSGNARANTPAEVDQGVAAIVAEVHARSPLTRVVVMAIFPRGEKPDSPLRAPIAATNALLRQRFTASTYPYVTYLDIGSRFLEPDGTLPAAIMPDGTHPSNAGYQLWADALKQAGVLP